MEYKTDIDLATLLDRTAGTSSQVQAIEDLQVTGELLPDSLNETKYIWSQALEQLKADPFILSLMERGLQNHSGVVTLRLDTAATMTVPGTNQVTNRSFAQVATGVVGVPAASNSPPPLFEGNTLDPVFGGTLLSAKVAGLKYYLAYEIAKLAYAEFKTAKENPLYSVPNSVIYTNSEGVSLSVGAYVLAQEPFVLQNRAVGKTLFTAAFPKESAEFISIDDALDPHKSFNWIWNNSTLPEQYHTSVSNQPASWSPGIPSVYIMSDLSMGLSQLNSRVDSGESDFVIVTGATSNSPASGAGIIYSDHSIRIVGPKSFVELDDATDVLKDGSLPSSFQGRIISFTGAHKDTFFLDADTVVSEFHKVTDFLTSGIAPPRASLAAYSVSLNGGVVVDTTYFKGNLFDQVSGATGLSTDNLLTLNPHFALQYEASQGYWWQHSNQTITLSTAGIVNPSTFNSLALGGLAGLVSSPTLIVGNLPVFAPTVNYNQSYNSLFPNSPIIPSLTFDVSAIASINGFLGQLPSIGAFYEGGELSYDESVSIAEMTARLYNNEVAVSSAAFNSLDSNTDGVIDENDADFDDLEIWQDVNENGIVDSGEMKSLTVAGIDEIALREKSFYVSSNAAAVVPEDVAALAGSFAASAPSAPSAPTNVAPTIPSGWGAPSFVTMAGSWNGTSTDYFILGTNSNDNFGDDYSSEYQNVVSSIGFGGDDVLGATNSGDTTNNRFWGGTGNDSVIAGAGDDKIMGEDGNDLAFGQLGNDTIWGDAGNDSLIGFYQSTDSVKTLSSGETDNDLILAGAGSDTIVGQAGNDTLSGEDGNDVVLGFTADDDTKAALNAYETDVDLLFGGAGNDTLSGNVGNDTLSGGADDDSIYGFYSHESHDKKTLASGETDNDLAFGGAGNVCPSVRSRGRAMTLKMVS